VTAVGLSDVCELGNIDGLEEVQPVLELVSPDDRACAGACLAVELAEDEPPPRLAQ